MSQQQRNTASIVDISEIDEEDEQVGTRSSMAPAGRQPCAASANPQLYLFHEHGAAAEQRTISSLLSSGGHLQLPGAGGARHSRSADTSPAQTLVREGAGSALPALDYHRSERAGSPSATQRGDTEFSSFTRTAAAACNGSQQQTGPASDEVASEHQQDQSKKANLGTLTGVFFPCVQNIFGVILFIRMVWIVGTAGVPAAFSLVFICCCVTLTTSISLSAIATNGIVPAGGSYFMISRSLGPECGGAVGTMFFLGTTVAGAMYITGAVEIMLNYLAPSWGLFGDFQRDVTIMYHNIRVYGTLLLIIVGLMVWVGVKFVSKLAPLALFCVLFSIASIYAGIFINYNGRPDLMICVLGDRLVTLKNIPYDEAPFEQQQQQQYLLGRQSPANQSLSARELQQQHELRRTRALCTYEKLRYIFCPNTDPQQQLLAAQAVEQTLDAQAAPAQQKPLTAQQQQEQLMRDLFSRPPNMSNCDAYFLKNRNQIHLERAVPGIASGVLFRNLKPRFRRKGTLVSYDDEGELDWAPGSKPAQHSQAAGAAEHADQEQTAGTNAPKQKNGYNLVFVDITTSFTILISIYFPSCTGILAGSNRSGDLADAQLSIPRGTISAQLCTSFIYLSCIVLFGSTFNNLFIRDKFGESMGGQLAVTQIAWPEPYFILIGGLLSTLGAALQSLVGAPRILQGIAKDDVIPCFRRFAKLSDRGEPETAILFTLAISWIAVLIGNLDFIAPILTIFLVMCYFFINLACTLHSLLGSPNWRPRFKHYHWSISTLGCFLCLFVMIVSSWLYFIIAILMASCIYKYIEFSGAQKEWGDGKQGLALSAATYNLLRLRTTEPHTKNWRPQLLLLCKLKPSHELEPLFSKAQQRQRSMQAALIQSSAGTMPSTVDGGSQQLAHQQQQAQSAEHSLVLAHPKLLTLASQLKAGKGLTLVSSVIEGDFQQCARQAQEARATLQEQIQRERVRGFADVVVASTIRDGLCYQIQTAGLGGLKHNTVLLGWPVHWRKPIVPAKPAGLGGRAQPAPSAPRQTAPGGNSANSGAGKLGATKTRAHLFIDLMRNVQVSQNALLVVKGVDNWPESCDKLGGTIDIWWIVNDGGLLMLLPHLLKQHRTWRSCQLRIFTVAQASDNSDQMRQDLAKFLYHLRIEAKVDIVVMKDTEISDYAYERTLMMEQRSEIIKRLNTNRKQSILLEQEVDGRLIRFSIRKPSIYELDGYEAPIGAGSAQLADHLPMVEMQSARSKEQLARVSEQVAVAEEDDEPEAGASESGEQEGASNRMHLANLRPDETNVRRMHTALSLNEAILQRSKQAKLVIINLPGAPNDNTPEAENNYMEFIEIITDKLERVLLVQNGGREVITIHS